MSHVARFVFAVLLASMWSGPAAAQHPPMTTGEVTQIQKEVTEAVEKYYRLFSERNMKALPEEIYNIPWILMTANGPQPNLTRAGACRLRSELETACRERLEIQRTADEGPRDVVDLFGVGYRLQQEDREYAIRSRV